MATSDESWMKQAIELAQRGQGKVEPNPMVGCVLVRQDELIGEGWHQEFGGPHAEIQALNSTDATGATAYVTLEPCSHTGKTGPCADALIQANVARVVIACRDPNPLVAGQGIERLRTAGIEVEVGVSTKDAQQVLAPFLKRIERKTPWIIAKWAMTLDGKIATASGDSQWISNEQSRSIVHQIRGRVDGVMVGIGTALADDPMLNARPPGPRNATRIVLDTQARLPLNSHLVQTCRQHPTMIVVGPDVADSKVAALEDSGCSIFRPNAQDPGQRLRELLVHLGELGMTNVLVEGGGKLLGALNDIQEIDEFHIFLGPKIIGGSAAPSPVGGSGINWIKEASELDIIHVQQLGNDVYLIGRTPLSCHGRE